jgi:hypothetical protein
MTTAATMTKKLHIYYIFCICLATCRHTFQQGIHSANTRLFKTVQPETGIPSYEIRVASVKGTCDDVSDCDESNTLGEHRFSPDVPQEDTDTAFTVSVTRGDYSGLLKLVVENLRKAEVSGCFFFLFYIHFPCVV